MLWELDTQVGHALYCSLLVVIVPATAITLPVNKLFCIDSIVITVPTPGEEAYGDLIGWPLFTATSRVTYTRICTIPGRGIPSMA